MEIFVLHILKLNIIAAVIILLVKLLAILFKGQVSARWKYIIWLLITVSLCIPVRLPANFTLVDFKTKQPWLNVDFANVTTTEMAATRVLAKGGRGAAPRVPFDGERTCTMKVDTQITPMKLFAMLAGPEILTSERLTLAAGKLTLSEEPVANSVTVYKADDDCGAAISATVAEKAATIEDGSDGDEYIVYYMANKEQGIQIVKFKSDVFPKAYTAYGETLYKTEDDELLPMKLVIHKAVPQAAFSLALSNTGDPSTLSMTFDLFAVDGNDFLDMQLIEG